MDKIQRAYQILELEPGASFEEVERAYRELMLAWHPDRFPFHEALQEKAKKKREEIRQAFETLKGLQAAPGSSTPQSPAATLAAAKTPSLYDDTFAERTAPGAKRLFPLLVIGTVTVVALALGISYWSGPERQTVETTPQAPALEFELDTPHLQEKEESGPVETEPGPRAEPVSSPAQEQSQSSPQPVTAPRTAPPPPQPGARGSRSGEKPRLRVELITPEASKGAMVERSRPSDSPSAAPTPSAPAPQPSPETGSGEPPTPPDTPTELEYKAFQTLQEKSPALTRLVQGSSSLRYREWKTVRRQGEEFWIDVIAIRPADGQEIHFIWSVNPSRGTVRALSQAARDLETPSPPG